MFRCRPRHRYRQRSRGDFGRQIKRSTEQIRGVTLQLDDVRKWNSAQHPDVITANLYSDLLIEVVPKLRGSVWLILSGILRRQKEQLLRALQRNHYEIISTKLRGKWVAILARRIDTLRPTDRGAGEFLRRSRTAATIKTDAI